MYRNHAYANPGSSGRAGQWRLFLLSPQVALCEQLMQKSQEEKRAGAKQQLFGIWESPSGN